MARSQYPTQSVALIDNGGRAGAAAGARSLARRQQRERGRGPHLLVAMHGVLIRVEGRRVGGAARVGGAEGHEQRGVVGRVRRRP
eukprot:575924-Prymnesium_polylepis.1